MTFSLTTMTTMHGDHMVTPLGSAMQYLYLYVFQGVHSMRCFVWQDNMVLMSRFVRDDVRMVRAASSGDELDV